jgi:hypothetical protein
MELPFSDMNPFTLTGLAAGMQWTGQPQYRRPFDNGGTSSFNTAGGVGQLDAAEPAKAIKLVQIQERAFGKSIPFAILFTRTSVAIRTRGRLDAGCSPSRPHPKCLHFADP